MLVDNTLDLAEYLNTELFSTATASASQPSPPTAFSSPSSTSQGLLTPPQPAPAPTFHDANDALSAFTLFDDDLKLIDTLTPSHFDFLPVGPSSLDHTIGGYSIPMDLSFPSMADLGMNMGSGLGLNMPIAPVSDDHIQQMSIDPQLVDTPASASPIDSFDNEDHADDGDDEDSSQNSSAGTPPALAEKEEGRERLTLTIAPVKAGGYGKARKGTVQSGGVVKKSATSSIHRDKENVLSSALYSSSAHNAASSASAAAASASALPSTSTSTSVPQTKAGILPKPPTILKALNSKKDKAKADAEIDEEEEDDVPQDWRPSPEVFAKMTSKEKRQLRNKISARNFRVRRKEYISTLEGDIAERDRLLEAVRSELGSTQSENLALRQEIEALKKVLLEGRGATDLPLLNLPPPAPLPVGMPAFSTTSATTTAAAAAPTSTENSVPSPPSTPTPHQQSNATANATNPFAPNTQKDLPSSPMPRNGAGFWGGQRSLIAGMGGGVTPVHTALVPELNLGLWGWNGNKNVLADSTGTNINPLMNAISAGVVGREATQQEKKKEERLSGFDAFADTNLFTMKSLDTYRMKLWGQMAAQHHTHHQQIAQQIAQQTPHPQLSGLAHALRPSFFTAHPLLPKAGVPTSAGMGNTLAAILSGKHTSTPASSGLLTPPASPRLVGQELPRQQQQLQSSSQQQQRDAQAAMLAVVASQTLFKKLGNAFWDAFSGSSSSSSALASTATKTWDAEKVRKVLEGTAVVRVVDVESAPVPPPAPAVSTVVTTNVNTDVGRKICEDVKCCVGEILEESMRSLTLGKGSGASVRRN